MFACVCNEMFDAVSQRDRRPVRCSCRLGYFASFYHWANVLVTKIVKFECLSIFSTQANHCAASRRRRWSSRCIPQTRTYNVSINCYLFGVAVWFPCLCHTAGKVSDLGAILPNFEAADINRVVADTDSPGPRHIFRIWRHFLSIC